MQTVDTINSNRVSKLLLRTYIYTTYVDIHFYVMFTNVFIILIQTRFIIINFISNFRTNLI